MELNFLEDEIYSEGSLDVLAQHIVGVAISQKFKKKIYINKLKKHGRTEILILKILKKLFHLLKMAVIPFRLMKSIHG